VNAYRQVDLCPALAALLKQLITERCEGLLFATRTGKPLHQSNLLRRSLHPILKTIGAEKTGAHKSPGKLETLPGFVVTESRPNSAASDRSRMSRSA
jgi:hypothetical protein